MFTRVEQEEIIAIYQIKGILIRIYSLKKLGFFFLVKILYLKDWDILDGFFKGGDAYYNKPKDNMKSLVIMKEINILRDFIPFICFSGITLG